MTSNNKDNCNMVIKIINDMKEKLVLNERGSNICKSLNISDNSRMNCESVDGTSKEGSNKILTPWVVCNKGHPLFKRKQSKID